MQLNTHSNGNTVLHCSDINFILNFMPVLSLYVSRDFLFPMSYNTIVLIKYIIPTITNVLHTGRKTNPKSLIFSCKFLCTKKSQIKSAKSVPIKIDEAAPTSPNLIVRGKIEIAINIILQRVILKERFGFP